MPKKSDAATKEQTVAWKQVPDEKDYPAAQQYLELLFSPAEAKRLANGLRRRVHTSAYKAKDVLRAAQLPPLSAKQSGEVKQALKHIDKGIELSPILLVQSEGRLIIADGYHRTCAAYATAEDTTVPCHIHHGVGARP